MVDSKNYLIDVLKNPSFKLNLVDGKLSKNDSIYFKTVLKNLINENKKIKENPELYEQYKNKQNERRRKKE